MSSVLLGLVVFSFESFGASKLKVGYFPAPPFSFKTASNKPGGIFNARLKKVLVKAKIPHEFVYMPIEKVFDHISSGSVNMVPCGTQEFEGVKLTKNTIVAMKMRTYRLGSRKELRNLKGVDDLFGKKLILFKGVSYGGLANQLMSKANKRLITEMKRPKDMFEALMGKRSDYLLAYERSAEEYFRRYNKQRSKFKSHLVKQIDCKIMMSIKTPDYEKVLGALDKSLSQL